MNEIKHIILKGLLKDIGTADRCFRLNRKISNRHNEITEKVKKDISYILYDLSYTEMVLSLSRLYDIPSKKYPTMCLKELHKIAKEKNLLEYLKKFRPESELNLHNYGFASEFITLLKGSSDEEFILRSTNFFELIEINDPICNHLEKLKIIRDKLLAHNEDIKVDTLIPYEMTQDLLDHAKKVASFYSITYTGVHLNGGSHFTTDRISTKWERVFERFLKD